MIIFDFDQTLVDTSSVEHLRAARNWKAVMAQASKLPVYEGINELIQELHESGQTIAIVTKSPDMVPKAFIKAHSWPIDIVVGYHHVKNRKPHPEGLLLAMSKAGAAPDDTYHVGDQPQDTEASRGASVIAVGSAWGCADTSELEASKPDVMFASVAELREYFRAELGMDD
ncbi:HAD family hydrolase [Brucella anthropi]|jgi:HAD superfamily hydrolase (TIGR01549 family)|uniref:HAD family hydrolase n=1 Tax=Brucella anthropi TaxID=529 RepID=UPI0021571E84|nr:HAD-IA family hydrolase [Brucella anthropi]MCR8493915.1 HAD-IA family hydrolase [Brucella anthropi]